MGGVGVGGGCKLAACWCYIEATPCPSSLHPSGRFVRLSCLWSRGTRDSVCNWCIFMQRSACSPAALLDVHSYTHTPIRLFMHWFIPSFIHSFIHPFIHVCMHACILLPCDIFAHILHSMYVGQIDGLATTKLVVQDLQAQKKSSAISFWIQRSEFHCAIKEKCFFLLLSHTAAVWIWKATYVKKSHRFRYPHTYCKYPRLYNKSAPFHARRVNWLLCSPTNFQWSCRFDKLFILMERSFEDLLVVRQHLDSDQHEARHTLPVQVSQLCASVGQQSSETEWSRWNWMRLVRLMMQDSLILVAYLGKASFWDVFKVWSDERQQHQQSSSRVEGGDLGQSISLGRNIAFSRAA